MNSVLRIPTVRLDFVSSQIVALQSRLKGLRTDGRPGLIGPVEALVLNIELAELQLEHKVLVSRLPM
jgi:hypothetical protein